MTRKRNATTPLRLGLVVEGHGDVEAAPILVRRIAHCICEDLVIAIPKPVRCARTKIAHDHTELVRAVTLAHAKAKRGPVLVILDADDDCPAQMSERFFEILRNSLPHVEVAVVFAKREYEAWFIAAFTSLEKHCDIRPGTVIPPEDAEAIRGAKEWLSKHLKRRYRETIDQPAFTRIFNLDEARERSPSFKKLWRDIEKILSA